MRASRPKELLHAVLILKDFLQEPDPEGTLSPQITACASEFASLRLH